MRTLAIVLGSGYRRFESEIPQRSGGRYLC
jgi:hypothetical protein